MAIVQAIEELLNQPQLTEDLAQRGYQRLAKFRQEDMVRRYLEIFDQTLQEAKITTDGLRGVFADGWLSQEMEISYTAYDDTRILELILSAPAWLPYRKITIQYKNNAASAERWFLSRGRTTTLRLPLSPEGGHITLCASPLFKPSERLNSNDERWLSCLCQSCRIVYPDGSHNVLF